jgi:hypothetical protein
MCSYYYGLSLFLYFLDVGCRLLILILILIIDNDRSIIRISNICPSLLVQSSSAVAPAIGGYRRTTVVIRICSIEYRIFRTLDIGPRLASSSFAS